MDTKKQELTKENDDTKHGSLDEDRITEILLSLSGGLLTLQLKSVTSKK